MRLELLRARVGLGGLGVGSRPGNDRGRRPSESPTHERRCAISRGGGRDGYEGELREDEATFKVEIRGKAAGCPNVTL